ncbi:alpha-(1-_3)-arabinofuranosyltransferase family protein [Nocardioides sp.]|uniref:alpha-(1->3)-arabinofuranosyltransferase domain-containing protein n=1 Tax=Nocardioides sp. TaxID=35761 RepID=UPI0039E392BD
MEPPARGAQALSEQPGSRAQSRVRLAGFAAVWTALAFSQATGRIVADTKWDLVAAPWRFLAGGTRLWDARAAFGQIQNQADGYLWPMGPFFVLGRLAALPEWVVQRLWWALLLNLAFFGMLRLLRELRVGGPWPQLAAAAGYVLAPRVTTILGETSVELWPTAIAPWVLVVLVRDRGPAARTGALAALLVACCGGVNATAVSAVIPAGVVWLLLRRRFALLAWWGGFTVLATAWWLVPLILQGRYAAPFLDYIENAAVTSSATDLVSSLSGTSHWAAYLGAAGYPAGASLVSTPFLLLDAAAVAAVGLLGLARADQPHRRFAVLTLLTGLVLVGLGYAGEVHGWLAGDRRSLLDGALAALRNTHKYDVVVRLALSLGVAHALTVLAASLAASGAGLARLSTRTVAAATAAALVGLGFPWLAGEVAAPRGFEAAPSYWRQAAAFLADQPGTALVMPAASFGDYTWGSTHDDVLQPYAEGRWAVRNVVPLAEPGNVVLLDEVTELLESGRPSDRLAPLLATAGVGSLVIRNDLDRFTTGAPDPAYVHAALDGAPGLTRVATFGPESGLAQVQTADDVRVLGDHGLSGSYHAVEVYRVAAATDATLTPAGVSVMGDPGDGLPLTGDVADPEHVVLTDGSRRQETAFQAVRGNHAATTPAGSRPRLSGREQFHRILPDQERWQTTQTWRGVADVTASASQADADAPPPLERGASAAAAVDDDPTTAWRTPRGTDPDGQWLQLDLATAAAVPSVSITLPGDAVAVSRLRVTAGPISKEVAAPPPGGSVTVPMRVASASSVRVTAVGGQAGQAGQWGIAELDVPGVSARRVLALPAPPDGAVVDRIELTRDDGATGCPTVAGTVTCLALLAEQGEDGDRIDRLLTLADETTYDVAGTGSLRRSPGLSDTVARAVGVELTSEGSLAAEIAESPVAVLDGDLGTSWRGGINAAITLGFDTPRRIDSLTLRVGAAAPVSQPARVVVSGEDWSLARRVRRDGSVPLPGKTTSRLSVRIIRARPALTTDGVTTQQLDPGISELLLDGAPLTDGVVTLGCGEGPTVTAGGRTLRTGATATLAGLLRGEEVALTVCGEDSLSLGTGEVAAAPSTLLRADTLDLVRPGATVVRSAPLPLTRDDLGAPLRAEVPAGDSDRVLALPQNFNAGWVATLDGERLRAQRVDGWQQGWVVPAGSAGTVSFSYPPDRPFRLGLLVGLGGVLLTAAVALALRRRRRPAAEPDAGRPRPGARALEGAVVALALGLLGGWSGLLLGGVVVVVLWRRPDGLDLAGPLAALALLLAVVPRAVAGLDGLAPVGQWCGLLAVALVAGSLLASGPRSLSRSSGDSSQR